MDQTLASPSSAAASARAVRRIAVVAASWHAELVERAVAALMGELKPPDFDVAIHRVPGAFEIPLLARRLAHSGACDAIVACGFVVDGGIYRHDFVASAVIDALMQVQLEADVPVLSVVLTPQQFHEHAVHARFFADHMAVKGREAASACRQMLDALDALVPNATPGCASQEANARAAQPA